MGFFSPEQTSTNYLVPAKLRASRNIGAPSPIRKPKRLTQETELPGADTHALRTALRGARQTTLVSKRGTWGRIISVLYARSSQLHSETSGGKKRPAFDLGFFWHYRSACPREAKSQSAEAGNSIQNRKNLYPSQGFSHENARLRRQACPAQLGEAPAEDRRLGSNRDRRRPGTRR